MRLEDYLTTAEAAKFTGYSLPHIYKLIREQKIKVARFGKAYLVEKQSLENYKPQPVGRPKTSSG